MIKEVIFFTYGDSSDASTWSNIPFLFTKTLKDMDVEVHQIDISPNKNMRRLYDKIIVPIISLFYPNHVYVFLRSKLFASLVNHRIKRSVTKYSNSDLCIITNFDYYNKFNKIPTLLFCDWTYEILIIERLGRKPYFFEKRFILQQEEAINNAETVVSLFPECAISMRKRYANPNIHYLGSNVINSLYDGIIDPETIIKDKINSTHIIFIGGKKYIEGAQKLVDSFKPFSRKHPEYSLHLIGIKQNWIREINSKIICYGYLRKDIKSENKNYYHLLLKARFIINPTPVWAGYSSTIEAMYFYTPVITSNYKDFVNEFGENIDFGYYLDNFSPEYISQIMEKMILSNNYIQMCKNAHEKVKDYTWKSYVNKILKVVESENFYIDLNGNN